MSYGSRVISCLQMVTLVPLYVCRGNANDRWVLTYRFLVLICSWRPKRYESSSKPIVVLKFALLGPCRVGGEEGRLFNGLSQNLVVPGTTRSELYQQAPLQQIATKREWPI